MGTLLFSGKTFQSDQQSDKTEQRKRKLCGCRGIGSTEPEVINPGGESRHRKSWTVPKSARVSINARLTPTATAGRAIGKAIFKKPYRVRSPRIRPASVNAGDCC